MRHDLPNKVHQLDFGIGFLRKPKKQKELKFQSTGQ